MSAGPVSPIQTTFISRAGGNLSENDGPPASTKLNFTTDVRNLSGAFDIEVELASDESFPVNSHDFVEFWFMANGRKFQIGVGFLERLHTDDTPNSAVIIANGREFTGQMIKMPFRKQIQGTLNYETFLRKVIPQSYIPSYAAFRGLKDVLRKVNSYAGSLTVLTQQTQMVGDLLTQYAELSLNIAYQNRLGQLEVYGRGTDAIALKIPTAMGTLCEGFGATNVESISQDQDFSKVSSECTVFWSDNQAYVDGSSPTLNSQRIMNSDPRITGPAIYQPKMKVFAADDLAALAGGVSATTRVSQVAQSEIRKSMQNINVVTVTTAYPYYTPPETNNSQLLPGLAAGLSNLIPGAVSSLANLLTSAAAATIPFEVQQLWRIRSQRRGIDQVMRLIGIHYAQDPASLEVQLAFVEPDTLI